MSSWNQSDHVVCATTTMGTPPAYKARLTFDAVVRLVDGMNGGLGRAMVTPSIHALADAVGQRLPPEPRFWKRKWKCECRCLLVLHLGDFGRFARFADAFDDIDVSADEWYAYAGKVTPVPSASRRNASVCSPCLTLNCDAVSLMSVRCDHRIACGQRMLAHWRLGTLSSCQCSIK
jgi:hypothetical protein